MDVLWILFNLLMLCSLSLGKRKFTISKFLEKFGYLDDLPAGQEKIGHSPKSRSSAIREFQKFNGLRVTGNLDEKTVKKMKSPRCGLPDVVKPKDRVKGKILASRPTGGQSSPLAFYAPGYKWKKDRITWKIKGYTRQLGGPSQRRSYYDAFKKWTDVMGLGVSETTGPADIEVSFGSYSHGDGVGNSFDGEGGTLAHAFFPGDSPIAGDTHFDESEVWTLGEDRGSNLEIVAAHEFGHALGLGHSSVPDALMAPFYQGYDPNFALHNDDIMAIRSLYPPRRAPTRPRTTTPTPRRTTTRRPRRTTAKPRRTTSRPRTTKKPKKKVRRRCKYRFDALLKAHDGKTYVFIKRNLFEVNSKGIVWKSRKRIRDVFPRAPLKSVGGATHNFGKNYLFKGSKVYRYTGYKLDRGYPKRLAHVAYKGAQAVLGRRDGIYLFKGRNYTFWREELSKPTSGYPVNIARRYVGLPKINIDAAYAAADGYTYFFKGAKYWKVDRRHKTLPGYPKLKAAAWMPGCGRWAPR